MSRHKDAQDLKQHDRINFGGQHYRVIRTHLETSDEEMMKLVFCRVDNTGRDFILTLPKDTLIFVLN